MITMHDFTTEQLKSIIGFGMNVIEEFCKAMEE